MSISSEQAKEMQKASVSARISRKFLVEYQGQAPTRKRDTDVGWDLVAQESIWISPDKQAIIPSGSFIKFPQGYGYLITARSSMICRGLLTQTAVIDATYTGELKVAIHNLTEEPCLIEKGDRIAQIVPLPILHPQFKNVKQFSETSSDRGKKGWGSSGK